MALEVGSVSVSSEGAASGSGLALALFDAMVGDKSAAIQKAVGAQLSVYCQRLAAAIVGHIKENAEVAVTVTTSDAGLQRDPADSTPTLAPAEQKTLQGSIT